MPGQHSITPVEALQDGLAHIPNGISDLLLNEIRWQDELYSRDGERRCDIPPNASEWLSELFEFGSDGVLRQAEETVADNQLIESRNETAGIDALAWYVPFHSGHSRWGIHIPIVGVAYLARHAFGHLPDPRVRWVLALDALHAHEFNHFTVEYFVALWEVLHGEAIWRSSTERLRHKKLGYILAEERLANAYMIRKVRRGGAYHALAGKTDGLRAFTSGQPRG